MKYAKRIAQARDAARDADDSIAIVQENAIVQEAMNEVAKRMTELANEFSGKDLVFVVAAMMLLQPQFERSLGPKGCAAAHDLAKAGICIVTEKKN